MSACPPPIVDAAAACPFSERYFRDALGQFPTGVTVVTCWDAQHAVPVGMTVSSFNSVSLAPPLVLWSLGHITRVAPVFLRASHWAVHVLSAQQIGLAHQFAGRTEQRFDGVRYTTNAQGVPILQDVCAVFECAAFAHHAAGDHTIMVGQVLQCTHAAQPPLLYHAGQLQAVSMR